MPEARTTAERLGRAGLVLLLAIAAVHGGFAIGRSVFGSASSGMDFAQYYVAARLVLAGEPAAMYDAGDHYQQRAAELGIQGVEVSPGKRRNVTTYVYPPLMAYLSVPLALLPYRPAAYLFNLVSLLAVLGGVLLLFADRAEGRRRAMLAVGLTAAFMFEPVHEALRLGLVDCVVFLLFGLALYFVRHRRPWLAGLSVAAAVNIRLSPLLLVGFFLLRREYLAALASTVLSAVLAAIPAVLGGPGLYATFVRDVLPVNYSAGSYFRNQGIEGLVSRLFAANEYVQPVGDWPGLVRPLALGAGLVVLAVTFFYVWRAVRRGQSSLDVDFAVFLAASLLFQAKSYEHHAVALLFLFLFVFEQLVFEQQRTPLLAVLLASFAVWTFLLTREVDYEKLPRFVFMQPVFSAKFFATLAAWAVGVRLIATWRKAPEAQLRV
jgi:hypothetical protein